MRASTATELPWPAAPASQPDPEPDDLAACLAGPNGLDLVVEMAHDLRSPLTSIVLLAEALQSGQSGAVSAAQQRELGLIYSAALSLCGTASDVIELARGSTRLVDRQAVAFSVAELFSSVRSMVLPLAVVKGLEVRLVPPVPERRVGHPFLLRAGRAARYLSSIDGAPGVALPPQTTPACDSGVASEIPVALGSDRLPRSTWTIRDRV